MKEKIIITSGRKYIDIDAYAGIFAYQILLTSLGYEVYTKTSAYINESIPKVVLDMNFKFDDVSTDENTKFIVLDVSNPDFFDTFVKEENIIEIIDHHIGYESYWEKTNVKTEIDFIGSICTIIFERFLKLGKEKLLTTNLCKILIAGILDNTLNLKSQNTTSRDIEAYKKLMIIGNVEENWSEVYFKSCYERIGDNLEESIKNDTKIENTSSVLPIVFGQLIVLDIDIILSNLEESLSPFAEYDEWMFNVISLSDGKSYLFYSDDIVKQNLLKLFDAASIPNCLVLNNCMLRKEIIKCAKEYDAKN